MTINYEKMDPKIKRAWVKDLRSGKFKRGKSYLARNGKHCCLGVYCETMIKLGHRIKKKTDKTTGITYYRQSASFPPSQVCNKGKLHGLAATSLTRKNDTGWSFKRIADWIEKNL